MNIRPIISAPKAVAFEGVKTKKIEREVTDNAQEADDQALFKKLLKIKEKQIESAIIIAEPGNNVAAIHLFPLPRRGNKISLIKIPTTNPRDPKSVPVSIDYFERGTKTGSLIRENHSIAVASSFVETKPIAEEAINHLLTIAKSWIAHH